MPRELVEFFVKFLTDEGDLVWCEPLLRSIRG